MADCRGFTLAARPESDFEDGFEPLLGNAGSETPPRPCVHPRPALSSPDTPQTLRLPVPARAADRRAGETHIADAATWWGRMCARSLEGAAADG